MSRSIKMKISEGIRTTITQDGAVLMNVSEGSMLTLNPTGSIIWQQISDGRSPEETAIRLASEFGIPREQAYADVNEFVQQLEAQHLIASLEASDARRPIGAKPTGLFCNLFGRRNSHTAQERGSK